MVFVCQGPYISTEGALVRHVAERFSAGRRPTGACTFSSSGLEVAEPLRCKVEPLRFRPRDEFLLISKPKPPLACPRHRERLTIETQARGEVRPHLIFILVF